MQQGIKELTYQDKIQLYHQFKFVCKGPLVDMRDWSEAQTVQYIDTYGTWTPHMINQIIEESRIRNKGLE